MLKPSVLLQKGAGLLELMLVIVIAAVIITASMQFYNSYKQSRDIALFQGSLAGIAQALNDYYYENCNNQATPVTDVSLEDLHQAGLLNRRNLYNPWGRFFVRIENTSGDTTKPFYVLQVGALINTTQTNYNIALANFLRGALNGDGVPGALASTTVTWTRLPTYITDDMQSRQWVMNQGPGQTIMPGRYMTAANTGMSSKFWMMADALHMFSLQQQIASSASYAGAVSACPN